MVENKDQRWAVLKVTLNHLSPQKVEFFFNSQEIINFSKETLCHVVNQLIIEIEVSGFSRAGSSRDVQGCVERVDLIFVESF